MQHGVTSRRWCGATAHVLAVLLDTATTALIGRVASTAVSATRGSSKTSVLTPTDYSFFGNNIAAGQFEAQVWAPVCSDPSVGEVQAREDVNFDWKRV